MTRYADIEAAAAPAGLIVMGAEHPTDGIGTRMLLGAGSSFWAIVSTSPEYLDGSPDPVDRFSTRVVSALAAQFEAEAAYPFGGPPYTPFIAWAKSSGRAWSSPTGMLVHDVAGLMISYRGALHFSERLEIPAPPAASPCTTCSEQPCTTACPIGALSATQAYDVPACHGFLGTDAGEDCMSLGCKARRACPVSRGFGRDPAQSAHHMRAFHPS
ncbi:MAG: ferredoxin [Pseudomonadota bacterium]